MSGDAMLPDGPVHLRWCGPFKAGRLCDELEKHDGERPHVYIIVSRFPKAERIAVYVGRCSNLRVRLKGHFCDTLGLKYWLRDDEGNWRDYDPKRWPVGFDDLQKYAPLARVEAERYEFYAAPCDLSVLNVVEGSLIAQLMHRADDQVICDNSRAERTHGRLELVHSSEEPMASELIGRLFGTSSGTQQFRQ